MGERSPRSQLRSMKRRYFFTAMTVYLVVFLLGYLLAELLFMIFEASPYVKLAAMILLFLLDYIFTDYLINRKWNDKWRLEAPDLLEVIRAPEPAYMSETPYQIKEEDVNKEQEVQPVRYHRTQHKTIERELQDEKQQTVKTAEEAADVQKKAEKPAEPNETAKNPERKTGTKKSRRNKRNHTDVKDSKMTDDSAMKKKDSASWAAGLDGMDTVEFTDAVIELENRYEKIPAEKEGSDMPDHLERKNAAKEAGAKKEKTAAEPAKDVSASGNTAEKSNGKKSSWMNSFDELDTVELEDAVNQMLENQAVPSRAESRKKKKSGKH